MWVFTERWIQPLRQQGVSERYSARKMATGSCVHAVRRERGGLHRTAGDSWMIGGDGESCGVHGRALVLREGAWQGGVV